MSTKSKLLAKTGDLQLPPEAAPAAPAPAEGAARASVFPPVIPGAGARTAPGQMLEFRTQLIARDEELARLRGELSEHEGSTPTRLLDPSSIVASAWANRHADAFRTAEFERLKADIAQAGGNVQPVKVRRLSGTGPQRYELIFGHRRHRACAELGLPVLATIDDGVRSDADLFAMMDRENRERADLSPYEQGAAYRRALDAGLYPSRRRLAEALGVSHTWVSNALQVAELPAAVVECFRSPLEIQHRHARLIAEALDKDARSVMRRAEKVRSAPARPPAGEVAAALTRADTRQAAPLARVLKVAGKPVGRWSADAAGGLRIELAPGAVAPDRHDAVIGALLAALQP